MRQAILAAEDAEFEHHIGIRPMRLLVTVVREPRLRAPAVLCRRQHAHAAARAQAVPQAGEDARAEGQGGRARAPDREALHQAGDLHALLQPDEPRPRRVRRRGRVAGVLRQVGRRTCRSRRPRTIAGILQLPERQSPYVNQKWATQRRNYALRRMADEGFITEAQAEAARKKPIVLAGLPARRTRPRRTSSRRCASTSSGSTARRRSTRPGSRSRPRSTPTCRRPRPGRSIAGCGTSTSGAATGSRRATRRRGHGAGRTPRAAVEPPDSRGRHRARGRDGGGRRRPQRAGVGRREDRPGPASGHGARAGRQARRRPRADRIPVDAAARRRPTS